jgi:hypothetical protein
VNVDPGSGTPEDIARRVLEPHGLTLDEVRPGVYSVVKSADSRVTRAEDPSGSKKTSASRTESSSDEPLYQVDVYASRYVIDEAAPAAALAELKREDVETFPGLNQDVMRVTRFLPGTASNALSSRSHVRGGRDDELAVFFDGVPLFEPFHYKDVQSLLGLLDPGSISKIDFFSGVFPARYGNRLSGVLDIAPRSGAGGNHHEIGASVLYTHGLSTGRLDSYPVEWLASVRRGNIGEFAEVLGYELTEPEFADALARVKVDLGDRSSLVVGGLLLDDGLSADIAQGTERGDFDYRDVTGWVGWNFRPDDRREIRATVAHTRRHTTRSGTLNRPGSAVGSLDDSRIFNTTSFRLESSAKAGNRITLNGGLEWYDYGAEFDYQSETTLEPRLAAALGRAPVQNNSALIDAHGEAYAAYASALVDLSRHLSIDLALRWDAQRFDSAFRDDQLSPRLSLQYRYDPATVLRLSWGRMAQTQRPDELHVQDGETAFHPAQRSTNTVLSLERRIRENALLRVEAYDKRVSDPTPHYENIFDPFALLPEIELDRVRFAPDRSRMYGAELSLRWHLSRAWSGWTSYSWSEATDQFGGTTVPRTWDQKHSVATGLAWSRGPWQFSGNLGWHSGWRRNALRPTVTGSDFELEPLNSRAWNDYLSLDLRAEWMKIFNKGALKVFVEVDNATEHANSCCVSYSLPPSGADAQLSPRTSTWLPRLYLLGVTWQLP